MELIVECYSGYTYAQEPRAFVWQGQRYIVQKVERVWRTPEGLHFRVVTGVENEGWRMEDGEWRMENGGWRVSLPTMSRPTPGL